MTDKKIRSYFKDLPEDLQEKCPEFANKNAGGAAGSARGKTGTSNLRGALLAGGLALAGVLTAVICVIAFNNKKPAPSEHGSVSVISETSDPAATATAVVTEPPLTAAPTESTAAAATPTATASELPATPTPTATVTVNVTPTPAPTSTSGSGPAVIVSSQREASYSILKVGSSGTAVRNLVQELINHADDQRHPYPGAHRSAAGNADAPKLHRSSYANAHAETYAHAGAHAAVRLPGSAGL